MSGKSIASETQTSTGSAGENQETTQTENQTTEDAVKDVKEDVMPRTKYLDLLDEKKKIQKQLKEFQERDRLAAEEKLKAEGNFQQIIAEREKELEALKSENENFKTRFKNGKKLKAFLGAVGTNLDDKWLSMIELENIQFKGDSEELDLSSVNKAVDNFKKLWPEALKSKSATLPTDAPNGKTTISASEWKKLSGKEMAKYKMDQIIWEK